MNYHKIRNIEKSVCTCEQMIAYNIAFDAHISFGDKYQKAVEVSAICADEALHDIIQREMNIWKRNEASKKYDIDAIFSALLAGLHDYLVKPFIATDYIQIGQAFPALYLNK